MRVLILEYKSRPEELHAALSKRAELVLLVRLEPDLGGVWSEFPPEGEIIRIGFPANSKYDFFRVLDPRPGKDTCAKVALERTVFGRRIGDVICLEPDLRRVVAHALAGHDVRAWFGPTPCAPEDCVRSVADADWREILSALESRAEAVP